jgi:hypothetical protein
LFRRRWSSLRAGGFTLGYALERGRGTSTGSPAVSTTFPPQQPGRHGWAELLTLVGAVRRHAFDRTLPPAEALGRIRDHFRCNAMARRDDY